MEGHVLLEEWEKWKKKKICSASLASPILIRFFYSSSPFSVFSDLTCSWFVWARQLLTGELCFLSLKACFYLLENFLKTCFWKSEGRKLIREREKKKDKRGRGSKPSILWQTYRQSSALSAQRLTVFPSRQTICSKQSLCFPSGGWKSEAGKKRQVIKLVVSRSHLQEGRQFMQKSGQNKLGAVVAAFHGIRTNCRRK